MIKGVVIATMLTMIACSNEAEVSEETVVDEQLPAGTTFDVSDLPAVPVAEEVTEEEVAEEEVADSIADEV
jgi:hypothetical protein